ncbi:MAG TPA: alpha/beta fold hydrolase [Cyclobacteriaceae bacterium]
MTRPVLFIHSGGSQGPHEGSSDLVSYLRAGLSKDHVVLYPKMPDPEHPEYDLWKLTIQRELSALEQAIILVGHSLGGSVLLKYLSEEPCDKSIAGLFLVAPPYWGKKDWKVDEYVLLNDFDARLPEIPRIFLYHSRNDEVVPFRHLIHYADKLPNSIGRAFENRGHLFSTGLPELVNDIKNLSYEKVDSQSARRY